jgi:hypothetical protein
VPAGISAVVMLVLLGVVGGDMGRRDGSHARTAGAPEPAPLAH